MKFPTRSLSEIATLITKGTTPSQAMGGFSEFGINYIKSESLSYDGSINASKFVFISEDVHTKLKRSQIKDGDILYSIAGVNLGKCGIAYSEILPANTNQAVAIIRIDRKLASSRFVSYVLRDIGFVRSVLGGVAQSAQPNVNLSDIGRFQIPDVRLAEQIAIAEILSALDDKIELNRRMNETLEAMAQTIFRDWFVTFGPTRRKVEGATDPVVILGGLIPDPEKAKPIAALFPDSISEDGLPKGWEDKGLDEVAEFLNGLALQKYPPTGDDDLPVIKIAELRSGITAKTNRANRTIADKYLIRDGDFLFSWSGSLMAKFWTEGEGALNQHLFKVSSSTHPRWFYSQWVHHHMAEFQTIAASKATTMGHIQRGHLSAARVIVPPKRTLEAMTAIVEPLIERTIHNDIENRTLAETRDYLLPKLMSGAVRVRDAEEFARDEAVVLDASETGNVYAFPTDLLGQPYLTPEQETERDAVMAASVVRAFRSGDTVVGNVKVQKGCYFIRRRAGISVSNFEKQAAGPYDRNLNHEGGKGEAKSRKWIRHTSRATAGGQYIEGNVPDVKIHEIDSLLKQYELTEATEWVVRHFASKSRDELECLATVDFAMRSLAGRQTPVSLEAIKADIASDPVWKPKLAKPHFSDAKIQEAIRFLERLFGGIPDE